MTALRTERDPLGSVELPADALHGIHTVRACENFPLAGRPVHPALVQAYGAVKLACARANHDLGRWDEATFGAIASACTEMSEGRLTEHIRVDALQGGAGTSTNMNVNEVLANRALVLLGAAPGDEARLSPLDDLNLHQSTNDTYPTALRVAAIRLLRELQAAVLALQEAFQEREKAFAQVVKVGRTEFQDAVLTTLGREMSAYAEALSRDRWRLYKCEERLRVVNLGGTAIGTGLAAPRAYIFRVVEHLRAITGLGLARAENLVDATQNADPFVEVSGIVKALAVTLIKVANDLRLLSSGPDGGLGELRLPARQAGSSIMPGKVNPVIPEAVVQAALTAMAHDQALTQACALGSLELNAFMPLIAEALLSSLQVLTRACTILRQHCVVGLAADEARCRRHVDSSTATLTALVGHVGYEAALAIGEQARLTGCGIRAAALASGRVTAAEYDERVCAEAVMRLGSPSPRPDPARGAPA